MRVAIICPEFPPHATGGGGPLYAALAKELTRRGHDVFVIHGDYTRHAETMLDEGFKIASIPLLPTPGSMPYLRTALPPTLAGLLKAHRLLRRFKPDVAHLHGYALPYIDLTANVLLKKRIPFVVTVHGMPQTPNLMGTPISACYRWYQKHITSQTIKKAKIISAVSSFIADHEDLRGWSPRVVPNGSQHFASDSRSRNAYQSVQLFAYGRLAADKGFQYAIASMRHLRSQIPNAQLLIAGDDHGAKSYLQRLADEMAPGSVTFEARLTSRQIQMRLDESFAVIMPSLAEPFGLAAIEALSAGAPLIASRSGALPEIVRENVDGSLHEPGNDMDIAQKVLDLKNDRSLYERFCQNGPLRAKAYTWARMTAAYEALYSEAALG